MALMLFGGYHELFCVLLLPFLAVINSFDTAE